MVPWVPRVLFQVLALVISLLPAAAFAQTNAASQAARTWRQQHERAIVDEFVSLLSIPNIASDRANIQRNAEAIAAMMEKRGIASRLVSVPGGNPIVFGEIRTPARLERSVLCALRRPAARPEGMDLAAVRADPARQAGGRRWSSAAAASCAAFDPESRLYARGAADDKAPIVALLTAVDAIRAAGIAFKANIKFAFEGEEEARVAESRTNAGRQQGALRSRHLADVRCTGVPDAAAVHHLRCPRGHTGRHHRIRPAQRAAQRPLRQLGAQSGDVAGAAARLDERRQRPRARRALLRRCRAARARGEAGPR